MKINEIDINKLPFVLIADRCKLPNVFAVYFAFTDEQVLYIGATSGLKNRWKQHNQLAALSEYPNVKLAWIELETAEAVIKLEPLAINHFAPLLNSEAYARPTLASENIRVETQLWNIIKSRNKTMYAVAKETGVSYATVHSLCKKPVKQIPVEILFKLCQNLQCSANDFFGFDFSLKE